MTNMEEYAIWALVWPIIAVLACMASGLAVQWCMLARDAWRRTETVATRQRRADGPVQGPKLGPGRTYHSGGCR